MQNTLETSTPVQSTPTPPTPVAEPEVAPTEPPADLSAQLNPTPTEPEIAPDSTSAPKVAPTKTAKISFSQKLKLIRKKYEYINSQKMEPAAAEEKARAELNLPAMTDSEKARAGRKNIFERILALVGFDKKPTENSAPSAPESDSSEQKF